MYTILLCFHDREKWVKNDGIEMGLISLVTPRLAYSNRHLYLIYVIIGVTVVFSVTMHAVQLESVLQKPIHYEVL